jgi:hypothetical protein
VQRAAGPEEASAEGDGREERGSEQLKLEQQVEAPEQRMVRIGRHSAGGGTERESGWTAMHTHCQRVTADGADPTSKMDAPVGPAGRFSRSAAAARAAVCSGDAPR